MLPDNVLLEIFDFYRIHCESSYCPWTWHTLVHVCRRWRRIIFASPFRLRLEFVCTPRTRVRELLEFLPPSMPIMIRDYFDTPSRSCPRTEDMSQVIAALERRDDVNFVVLNDIPSPLLEKLATKMQETYPALEVVQLWASDETAPILRTEFLGGSAPRLQGLGLVKVPFPDAPLLLSSCRDLVHLQLERIPDSGYFSPDAMITALSTCTKLETLLITFIGNPHPDPTTQEIASLTHISLPGLTWFIFEGHCQYFYDFFFRIEDPIFTLAKDNFDMDDMHKRVHYEEKSLTSSGSALAFNYRETRLDPVPVEE